MAFGQLLSLPAAAAGVAPASAASAWTFGSYVTISTGLSTGMRVIGLQFQNTDTPALDVNQEILFEIAVDGVTTLQIPFNMNADTLVGYHMSSTASIQGFYLPEAVYFPKNAVVQVRVTDSIAAALTYAGVKLFYEVPAFQDYRSDLIAGLDSAQSEAAGWDAKVKANIPVANVVRTSDTVVTVTLQAQADYNITAQETVTATVPRLAMVASPAAVVGSPTFTVATSGGNITITAASGSFAMTGTAATVRHARRLIAASATYAMTGSAAALRVDRRVVASGGSYSVAGTAATLRVVRRLVAEPGVFTMTGTPAVIRRGFTLTAEPGVFTMTGAPATMRLDRRMVADSATVTMAGTDAVLRVDRRLSAASGAFVWTGTDATITLGQSNNRTISAASGSFVMTGTAADLRLARRVPAASGVFSMTGTDATVRRAFRLQAEPGSMVMTGTAASIRLARRLVTAPGAFTWSGTSATVARHLRLLAEAGGFTWTGTDASLVLGGPIRTIAAESGSFVMTGTPIMVIWRCTQLPWSEPPDPTNWRGPAWEGHPLRGIPIGGGLR